MKKFFLRIAGSIEGPYRISEIRQMLSDGKISTDDLCWTSGMFEWRRISDCIAGQKRVFSFTRVLHHIKMFTEEGIRNHFVLFSVLWFVSYPLYIINLQYLFVKILLFTGFGLGIVFIYRHWILIHEEARITPGKAVFYLFIPVFNLYGFFVSIAGLAEDNNLYMERFGIKDGKITYNLALAYYVAIVTGLVSTIQVILTYSHIDLDTMYLSHAGSYVLYNLSKLIDLAIMVLGYFFAYQQREAMLSIIDYKKARLKMDNLRDILIK